MGFLKQAEIREYVRPFSFSACTRKWERCSYSMKSRKRRSKDPRNILQQMYSKLQRNYVRSTLVWDAVITAYTLVKYGGLFSPYSQEPRRTQIFICTRKNQNRMFLLKFPHDNTSYLSLQHLTTDHRPTLNTLQFMFQLKLENKKSATMCSSIGLGS